MEEANQGGTAKRICSSLNEQVFFYFQYGYGGFAHEHQERRRAAQSVPEIL